MIKEIYRECMVRVTSRQVDTEGEAQTMETMSKGQLLEREGVLYVLYEESMQDLRSGDPADKEAAPRTVVKNFLKIQEGLFRVNIKKSGAVFWNMTFEQGKKEKSEYATPYGALEIGVETRTVKVRRAQKKTSLLLVYALFIQGEKQADCRLEIEIV